MLLPRPIPNNLHPNERKFLKLLLSIQANSGSPTLITATCYNPRLQETMIAAYEAELSAQGMATVQARVSPDRPSLAQLLYELTRREPILRSGAPAVVTVPNAIELVGPQSSSPPWAREGVLDFNFPIVLWLPDRSEDRLVNKPPGFWSLLDRLFVFSPEFQWNPTDQARP